MTNLTVIYLQANCLKELPESIKHLVNLEVLDVSCNELVSIPSTIGHLKQLKKLVLTQNKIKCLPDSIGQLASLVSLLLNFNSLQSLPYSLRNCLLLRELCIDRNSFQILPNFLTRLPNLQVLSVCGNKLLYLPFIPFAAIQHFHCDTNSQLTYLPYALACQMNQTPLNPLVTKGVLHIDCYGCFQRCQETHDTCASVSVTVKDAERDGRDYWRVDFPPHLHLSKSTEVPTLTELVLGSLIRREFEKIMTICGDHSLNIHHFKVSTLFNQHYDDWVQNLDAKLPSTLIELLRQGPTAFCFNMDCVKPIFATVYPLFVPKIMVQRPSPPHVALQRILCCLLFCSSHCFQRYQRVSQAWETVMFDSRLDDWNNV